MYTVVSLRALLRFLRAAPLFVLLLIFFALSGCEGELPSSLAPGLPEKGPPPSYPLVIPPSVYNTLPKDGMAEIEEALREQKRVRLFKTSALLPALEIVRTREDEFISAAKNAGMDVRLFQGLIVLECGGIPDAIDYMFRRGRGRRAHIGLGQIGAPEGKAAGLKVYPSYETRLKKEIRRSIQLVRDKNFDPGSISQTQYEAALLNSVRRQANLISEWKAVDERFDSEKNLKAAAKLLRGRMRTYKNDPTLTIASYHAGGGNIGKALRLYKASGGKSKRPTYWDLYRDRSGSVYKLMSGWSDNSRNYLPTVVAAADLVEKYLKKPEQFREEYVYWGPDDAEEKLAEVPYLSGQASMSAER